MTISIAMATYNGAKYLKAQLASIASQTRLPDELVVCDDCSLDSTVDMVSEFATNVPFRVRLIQNSARLGSTKNFEKAIGSCISDMIALCDQDDIWFPNKLQRQAAKMEQNPELGGVFSDAQLIDPQSHMAGKTLWQVNNFTLSAQRNITRGDILSTGVIKKKTLGCTLMFKSSLVKQIGSIPMRWEHDSWIAWIITIYSKLGIIPETLMCYRIHPRQQFGVGTLSLSQRMEVKAVRHSSHALQYIDLCDRIKLQPCPNEQFFLSNIQNMIDYENLRAHLPANRLVRARQVMHHFSNYRRCSSGWLSALKDLVL